MPNNHAPLEPNATQKERSVDRNAYSVAEFSYRNDIGHTKTYGEINAGRLEALKVGERTLITAEAEKKWLARLPKYQSKLEK